MPAGSSSDDLQFDRAEFDASTKRLTCSACGSTALREYYELGSQVFCAACRLRLEASLEQMRESGNFGRALLYGLGAAVAGALVFYAVSALTGYQFGLIAVVVGFMVGKAVRLGSGSLGGRRYQVLAVALTYFSIAATHLPAITKALNAPAHIHAGSLAFYGVAIALALALPFLTLTKDILGMVIIGIALWEAWKFTRAVKVEFKGPFTVNVPASESS